MRPTRLVVGEVRQEECLDLLVAMNAGMPSMCSLHANGAREALSKMVLLPMLAGSNVSADFVVPTVATIAMGRYPAARNRAWDASLPGLT